MEHKKNPKSDLKRWSGALFNLGLAASLAVVLVAFEWKAKDQILIKEISEIYSDWEILDIPITDQSPPSPPPLPVEVVIKSDDILLDKLTDFTFDINTTEETIIPKIEISVSPNIEKIDKIEDFVEVQATFNGGMDAWYAYLNKNLEYPSQAKRMGIEGMVIVRFVVNTDGSIQDLELVRTIGGGCDEVAREVIENSPKWTPGKIRGQVVRSRMTMPIRFKLN